MAATKLDAHEQLEAAGKLHELERRHMNWCLHIIKSERPERLLPSFVAAMAADQDNLLAALHCRPRGGVETIGNDRETSRRRSGRSAVGLESWCRREKGVSNVRQAQPPAAREALAAMVLQNLVASFAQAAHTTPIPVSIGWNQETLNGLNAINTFRAQQNPPLEPLQVDAVLQYAAAWEVNDQMTNGQCFGQSASRQQPNYFPYAPLTMSPQATCPHTDSLGRDPSARVTAFGYKGDGSENANFGAGDTNPVSITKGQTAYQGWYDLTDPDANGNPTYAHRLNMIAPQWRAVGLAEQCDVFLHRCFWVFNPGTCLMQPSTSPNGGPNPPLPQKPVPACAGAGTPVQMPPATLQPSAVPSFTGTWTVDNFDGGVGGPLTLTQTSNQVTGACSYSDPSGCMVNGTLTGTLAIDVLTYSTSYLPGCGTPTPYGGSTMRLLGDGQSFVGGSNWNGARTAAAAPTAGGGTP